MQASSLSERIGLAGTLLLALMASGCGPQYEIDRPGTWRPTGANEYNLRAMVADKRDLVSGEAATTDRGGTAVRAVTRLYTERRRPLLDVSLSKIAPQGGSDSGSGGGSDAGGAAGGVGTASGAAQ